MAKKTSKGNARTAKLAAAKLPAGFTAVSVGGGFGAWWEHDKQKTIQGKVVGIDSYQAEGEDGKKKTRRILRVDTGNGVVLNVGESFALKELFDTPKLKGRQIFIQYLGQKTFKDKKNRARKLNQFAAAVK